MVGGGGKERGRRQVGKNERAGGFREVAELTLSAREA